MGGARSSSKGLFYDFCLQQELCTQAIERTDAPNASFAKNKIFFKNTPRWVLPRSLTYSLYFTLVGNDQGLYALFKRSTDLKSYSVCTWWGFAGFYSAAGFELQMSRLCSHNQHSSNV